MCDVPSWRDDLDFFGGRHRHVKLRGGDTLDKRLRGPGALLELQLTPLDFEVVPAGIQLLELNEHLTRAVLAVNRARSRTQRSDPQNGDNDHKRFARQDVHTVTPPRSSDFLRYTQQRAA